MNRQQPLALAPPAGDADWTERSLLDGPARRALQSVNLAFLELAGELADEGLLKQIPGLPPRAVDALIGLEAAPQLCERLPFALFDLRFADGAYWATEVAAAAGVQDAAPAAPVDGRIVDFVRAAVMLVWHLSQTRAACARLAFGASPATIAAIANVPAAAVERLARRVAGTISARFGARTRFWMQFEGCASRPDAAAVDALRRLGMQIHGADSARSQSLQRRHRRNVA